MQWVNHERKLHLKGTKTEELKNADTVKYVIKYKLKRILFLISLYPNIGKIRELYLTIEEKKSI